MEVQTTDHYRSSLYISFSTFFSFFRLKKEINVLDEKGVSRVNDQEMFILEVNLSFNDSEYGQYVALTVV